MCEEAVRYGWGCFARSAGCVTGDGTLVPLDRPKCVKEMLGMGEAVVQDLLVGYPVMDISAIRQAKMCEGDVRYG